MSTRDASSICEANASGKATSAVRLPLHKFQKPVHANGCQDILCVRPWEAVQGLDHEATVLHSQTAATILIRCHGLAYWASPAPPHSHRANEKLPQFLLHKSWPRSLLGARATPCRTSPKPQSLTVGKHAGSLILANVLRKKVEGEALRGTTECKMLSAAALSSTTRKKSTLPRLVVTNLKRILSSSPPSSMWLSVAGPDCHVFEERAPGYQDTDNAQARLVLGHPLKAAFLHT